jgi:uncharacterized protein
MSAILLPLFIGSIAGVFSGLFGIGGGIIIIPLLVFFFQFPQQLASATSLVVFILPVGIAGVWQYYKAGVINTDHIKMGLLIGVGLMAGSYFGAKLGTQLSSQILQKAFAVVLLIIAVRLWVK